MSTINITDSNLNIQLRPAIIIAVLFFIYELMTIKSAKGDVFHDVPTNHTSNCIKINSDKNFDKLKGSSVYINGTEIDRIDRKIQIEKIYSDIVDVQIRKIGYLDYVKKLKMPTGDVCKEIRPDLQYDATLDSNNARKMTRTKLPIRTSAPTEHRTDTGMVSGQAPQSHLRQAENQVAEAAPSHSASNMSQDPPTYLPHLPQDDHRNGLIYVTILALFIISGIIFSLFKIKLRKNINTAETSKMPMNNFVGGQFDRAPREVLNAGLSTSKVTDQTRKLPIRVFISYSHNDENLYKALDVHLTPLLRENVIESWHHRDIQPGTEWAKQIDHNIDRADIIIFLISADFLKSEYCHNIEMRRAMERHNRGEARVIPIIVRSVYWEKTPFATLQVLPKGAKAVTTWADQDEAWTEIIHAIANIAEQVQRRANAQAI